MKDMRQAITELRIAENYFNLALTEKEVDYATHLYNTAIAKIDMLSREEEAN